MNIFSSPRRVAGCALLLGLTIFPSQTAPILVAPVEAAPAAKAATRKAAPLDAQDQRVVERLRWLLNKRVTRPNGSKINLLIVPTARASEGYFAQVKMSGAPAQLKKRFQVSDFALDARNVRLDVPSLFNGNRVKTYAATTALRAVITEQDLTTNLAKGGGTKDMGLRIRFLGDKIGVTGRLNYALINGPINGTAKLRLAPGHKVFLDILSLKLRGVEVPGFIKNQFSGHINPIISYEDLPFNPPFKSVKMVGNKAVLAT